MSNPPGYFDLPAGTVFAAARRHLARESGKADVLVSEQKAWREKADAFYAGKPWWIRCLRRLAENDVVCNGTAGHYGSDPQLIAAIGEYPDTTISSTGAHWCTRLTDVAAATRVLIAVDDWAVLAVESPDDAVPPRTK